MKNKKVLIVAFHFPPCSSSSGIQRTLSFTKYLGRYNWEPVVLSARPIAYEQKNPSQMGSIPHNVIVKRSLALDSARHLSIGGRYWERLALPDRWNNWWLSAVPAGIHLIKKHDIKAIWSTYPIPTAHNIASTLSQLSGLPWIADFRDPMVEHVSRTNEIYPKDLTLRESRLAVEMKAVRHAARLTFCTESARQIVADRYDNLSADRLLVIPNGYDEDAFHEATQKTSAIEKESKRRVLLHSGTIYPGTDRDPIPLLKGIKMLIDNDAIHPDKFELRFRSSSADNYLRDAINLIGIQSVTTILPPIPYRDALAEMLQADGLLALQGFTSNPAIPAKIYEYVRAQRPIIGLIDPEGETAAYLHKLGIKTSNINDPRAIADLILYWLKGNTYSLQAKLSEIECNSRENVTAQLANALNEL